MQKHLRPVWLIPVVVLLGMGTFFLPPVYNRVKPRFEGWVSSIKYFINPPDQAIFRPQQAQVNLAVTQIMQTFEATLISPPTITPTAALTFTPKITTTPLPESVSLEGFRYEDQKNRWNYCGPANLSMALNYWRWGGDRDAIARVIKPGLPDPKLDFIQQGKTDVNVMPDEMVDFVNDETEFRALYRLGGSIELAQKLIAAGYPFIAEKGYYEKDYTGKVAWLGHFQFVTGYNDLTKELIVQDTWNDGPNFRIPYEEYMSGEAWHSFNNLFIVVYPPERESEVIALLGPYADPAWAAQHALSIAEEKIHTASGIDLFFAWFAKGTSHVALRQYSEAAAAYDQAFVVYTELGKDNQERPYRMMWYQTGPYWAYFYTGRYQDVVNLANVTLTETISKPTLEESIYWRGRAKYMSGDTQGAMDDYREALKYHPNWEPAIQALQDLGFQP